MVDLNSLLVAAAISGVCLVVTVVPFWISRRGGGFLVTWAAGVGLIVMHLVVFWFYAQYAHPLLGAVACALLPVGVARLYESALQFVGARRSARVTAMISVPYVATMPALFLAGFDGIALIVQNLLVATLFALCARVFWSRRAEASLSLGALAAFHGALSVSFTLCAAVLLFGGLWSIGHAPSNWAEDINVVAAVVSMTGIGALMLSADQARLAGRHKAAAMTDALTGLMNRRGLTSKHDRPFGPRDAIAIFDIDHFKRVNDDYGHAVGDEVIRRFAAIARQHGRAGDSIARLGGEEFAVVMTDVKPKHARRIAEGIAKEFARDMVTGGAGDLINCTVSAGIAFGAVEGAALDDVLGRADRALYAAKRNGRNRVESGEWRLAG